MRAMRSTFNVYLFHPDNLPSPCFPYPLERTLCVPRFPGLVLCGVSYTRVTDLNKCVIATSTRSVKTRSNFESWRGPSRRFRSQTQSVQADLGRIIYFLLNDRALYSPQFFAQFTDHVSHTNSTFRFYLQSQTRNASMVDFVSGVLVRNVFSPKTSPRARSRPAR